jgi:hypothetical protein
MIDWSGEPVYQVLLAPSSLPSPAPQLCGLELLLAISVLAWLSRAFAVCQCAVIINQ